MTSYRSYKMKTRRFGKFSHRVGVKWWKFARIHWCQLVTIVDKLILHPRRFYCMFISVYIYPQTVMPWSSTSGFSGSQSFMFQFLARNQALSWGEGVPPPRKLMSIGTPEHVVFLVQFEESVHSCTCTVILVPWMKKSKKHIMNFSYIWRLSIWWIWIPKHPKLLPERISGVYSWEVLASCGGAEVLDWLGGVASITPFLVEWMPGKWVFRIVLSGVGGAPAV